MGIFSRTVSVKRTIWPYEDGWGVCIEQFGKPVTVMSHGQSKEVAESYAVEIRKKLKTRKP